MADDLLLWQWPRIGHDFSLPHDIFGKVPSGFHDLDSYCVLFHDFKLSVVTLLGPKTILGQPSRRKRGKSLLVRTRVRQPMWSCDVFGDICFFGHFRAKVLRHVFRGTLDHSDGVMLPDPRDQHS
jgi:hypothetical protein